MTNEILNYLSNTVTVSLGQKVFTINGICIQFDPREPVIDAETLDNMLAENDMAIKGFQDQQ